MQGSIQKRQGKRGTTWYAKFDVADPATGKRIYRRVSAATKKECETKLREAMHAAANGQTIKDDRLKLRDFLEQWLSSTQKTLRPSTHRRYCDLMRQHVIAKLGDTALAKLTPLDVQRLYEDRLAAGLSPTTVNQLHNILHRALKQAVRWQLVMRNVTDAVEAPRPANPEVHTWNAQQVTAVFAAAEGDEFEALWRLALLTGMRRGELLGVKWADVDLERGVLAVRRTLSRGTGGTWEEGAPKTAHGQRSIALPASAVESLRRHRMRQLEHRLQLGDIWEDHDFVFTNPIGGPLHVNSLMLRFRHLIAAADVPTIRFHDLRHTSATLLLAQGVHPKIVQERLGHANISITLDRYSHATMDMQRDAADRLDAALTGS